MSDPTAPAKGSPAAPPPARPGRSLFQNGNFRKLWLGSTASSAGTAIGGIITTWLVYTATYSPLAISLLGILQFLPTLAFGLLAGALIDRLDRRRLMVACDVARAVAFGALAVYVLLVGASTLVILLVVFAVATFSTIFRPATNATIPRILRPEEVTDGNGLLLGAGTVANFVGSPLGGLLLVVGGAALGLALNAATFAVSGALIFLMTIPTGPSAGPPAGGDRRSLVREVGEGIRYLASQRALLAITLAAMVANFFLSIWGGFTVIYVAVQLHQGATGFGIIAAAVGAGFAIGSVLPGRLHTERAAGRWVVLTWGVVGFFLIGLGFTESLWVAVILEVACGVFLSMGNTTWLSGVQRTVPDEFLGRYFATDEAGSFAMIPAALAVGGVLILILGVGWTLVLAGVGVLACNIGLAAVPEVRRWGRTASESPTNA
jgi:MFS family permease